MENLTLQQLINQTKEALIEAGASNYYQNVFKTLSKQLLLYAKEHDAESCHLKSNRRNGVQPIPVVLMP